MNHASKGECWAGEGSPALGEARERLGRWRQRHGGRGVRIPEEVWALAVVAARSEGVEATARALRLDRQRLAERLEGEPCGGRRVAVGGAHGEVAGFFELRLSEVAGGGPAVVELSGADGERLRVEVADARSLDLVALAHAFWSRGS